MELSFEEAEKMLWERLREHPEIENIVTNEAFRPSIKNILDALGMNIEILPLIENQLFLVLAFYSPLANFPQKVSETTGLSIQEAQRLTALLEQHILSPVHDELLAFNILWNEELKKAEQTKSLNSVPQIQQNQLAGEPRPLTREELMQKLAPRRTMVQDVASVQHPTASQPASTPAQGYEAYQNKNV